MSEIHVTVRPQRVGVAINGTEMEVSTGTPVAREYIERPAYTGQTEVTPSAETQTLETKNLRMTDDIVINPIPSNYGRIDWNGQFLQVS